MTRVLIAAACAAFAGLTPVNGRQSEPHRPVTIDVVVTKADGTPVSDRKAGDFSLTVDGQPVAIAGVELSPPLAAVLLVDVSGLPRSVEPPPARFAEMGLVPPPTIADAVDVFVRSGRPSDRRTIAAIGDRLLLEPALLGDTDLAALAARVMPRIRSLNRTGATPIVDAIHTLVTALAANTGVRAIVLLSDGASSGNAHSIEEMILHAADEGVSVGVLGFGAALTAPKAVSPLSMLQSIADRTGGVLELCNTRKTSGGEEIAGLKTSTKRILAGLQSTYAIRFVPPVRDGGRHTVRVAVKTPDLVVHARSSYVADR